MLLYFFAFLVAVASAAESIGFGTGFGVDTTDPKNPVISTGMNVGLGKKGTLNTKNTLGVGSKGVSTGISAGVTKNDDPMPLEKKDEIESTTSEVWTTTSSYWSSTELPKKVRRSEDAIEPTTTHWPIPETTSKLLDIILPSTTPKWIERPMHDVPVKKLPEFISSTTIWPSTTVWPPMTSSFPPVEIGSDEDDHSREEVMWPASSTVAFPDDKKKN